MGTAAIRYKPVRSEIRLGRMRQVGAAAPVAPAAGVAVVQTRLDSQQRPRGRDVSLQ